MNVNVSVIDWIERKWMIVSTSSRKRCSSTILSVPIGNSYATQSESYSKYLQMDK